MVSQVVVSYTNSPLLASLRGAIASPSREVIEFIVQQLVKGLENYYCHLPQKRSAFGIDPVAQLKVLATGVPSKFNRGLLTILNSLRDRHTTLTLPPPWKTLVAYVPLIIERVYDGERPYYLVTKRLYGYDDIPLGSTITHWNGSPIHLYVNNLAHGTQGASWPVQTALAMAGLTIRPLAYTLMPSEDWVTLTYLTPKGESRTAATPWRFFVQPPVQLSSDTVEGQEGGLHLGLDVRTSLIRQVQSTATGPASNRRSEMTQDGVLSYGTVDTPSGPCALLRITSFEVPDANAFIEKVTAILRQLPQERLVIDVRGNPGGLIPAGQKLVSLLTDRPIASSTIAFRATDSTLSLTRLQDFTQYHPSLLLHQETASVFSQSFPIIDYSKDVPNYRYPGRTALIIDALCYSTTDFFAADFADNKIGPIIGVDPQTGGGGANVWPWQTVVGYATATEGHNAPSALPWGYGLNLSMRRAFRTGDWAGLPIEGLGVKADILHRMTRRDLLEANADLLAVAAAALQNGNQQAATSHAG